MARLSDYRAKRDFDKTAEPRGTIPRLGAKAARFVIQRHDATRLHYDLRLELNGVYKSWAVTKTPSLDPSVRRLAVEVEDHPLEYGTFEGTIPEGEYGGGTVQLWDRGLWLPQGGDAVRALEKGHLKFVMNGERMKGGWVLVRMHDEPKKPGRRVRHNWLLIKEHDDYASSKNGDALAKEVTSVKTGRTLDEIAARKRAAKRKTAALKSAGSKKKRARRSPASSRRNSAASSKSRRKAKAGSMK